VSIALFVRHKQKEPKRRQAVIRYAAVGEDWRKERKWKWLEEKQDIGGVKWRKLVPDERHTWLHDEESAEFNGFLTLGYEGDQRAQQSGCKRPSSEPIRSGYRQTVTRWYTVSIANSLPKRAAQFCDDYNAEVSRFQRKRPESRELDDFLHYEK